MPGPVIPFEYPYKPELLPKVQAKIKEILNGNGTVFEYGSGHSTLWFAMMPAEVISVEHDFRWYQALKKEMRDKGVTAKVHLVREEYIPKVIDTYDKFDLILIDCLSWQRIRATSRARHHVKDGGYLVIDDSHWSIFRPVDRILEGWQRFDISGMHKRKTGLTRYHQTSFYQRDYV